MKMPNRTFYGGHKLFFLFLKSQPADTVVPKLPSLIMIKV